MVAHLISLKLRLTVNSWKRSTFQLVFSIIGLAYVAGLLVAAVFLMIALERDSVEVRGTALVLGMSVAVLLWLIIPVFVTGTDPTLDPRNFLTYGIAPRQLVVGLTLAGLISLPGLGTVFALLATGLAWRDNPLAAVAAIIGAVLGGLFCVVLSYAVTGLLSALAGKRRIREIISVIAIVPLIFAGLIIGQIAESLADLWDQLPQIAAVLAWTPLGSFTALPWAVAQGDLGRAGILLTLCVLWLLLGLAGWTLAIRRSVEGRGQGTGRTKSATGIGLLGWVPATPAGAIMGRSLIYWLKDPRYSASLVSVPALVVLFWFLGIQTDAPALVWFIGPLIGFLLGYAISADISYDGSAFAQHITAGVSGRDDRLGRIAGLLIWALPVTVLSTVASTGGTGSWEVLPGLLGLALAALLSGSGLSALVSARFIYPVPPPGASPFATPEGAMMRIMIVQTLSMLAALMLILPVGALFTVAMITGDALFHWLTLALGVILGTVLLWLGIRLGGRWYDRSQSETYQQVLRHA